MAKEISEKELSAASGGVGTVIGEAAFRALGLTCHGYLDTCDSFAPDRSLAEIASRGYNIDNCMFCSQCVYGAYVGSNRNDTIACMLKK